MKKEDIFNNIRDNYYEDKELHIDVLKDLVGPIMPIFGILEVELTPGDNNHKILSFHDKDQADVTVVPEGINMSLQEYTDMCDMSCTPLILRLNKDNKVICVNHGVGFLTPANKNLILFLGHLIGKTIKGV